MATAKTAGRALVGLALVLGASAASAQPPVVYRLEGPAERLAEWRLRLESHGAVAIEEVAPPSPRTPRRLVRVFTEVSAQVVQARAAAGQLDEAEALRLLDQARRKVEAHAQVPGASRWLAEVEATVGIVALQAGLTDVGEDALGRALSLDPSRRILPGEALPAVVARAQALAAERATAPEALFVVDADAPGARVYLDDRPQGDAPVEVRAPVGRHVLRVEAPGHQAWGRVVDVRAGRRLPIVVRLSPTPRWRALRALANASSPREASGWTEAAQVRLWWVEVGDGPRDRALLFECGPSGCSAPVHLEGAWHEPGPPIPWDAWVGARRLARRWLRAAPEVRLPEPPPPLRRRWQLWVPVGVAAAALAVGLGVGLRPEPSPRLQVRIDPTELTGD